MQRNHLQARVVCPARSCRLLRIAAAAVLALGLALPAPGLAVAGSGAGVDAGEAAPIVGDTAAAAQQIVDVHREVNAALELAEEAEGAVEEAPSAGSTPLSTAAAVRDAEGYETLGGLKIAGGENGTDYQATSYVGFTIVEILTGTPLRIKNANAVNGVPAASTDTYIQINPGVEATITLEGVNLAGVPGFNNAPINLKNDLTDTIDGSAAKSGADILHKTKLTLILADGTVNTLTGTPAGCQPGLRCGDGSVLVVDDSRLNVDKDGNPVEPEDGQVGRTCTLADGTRVQRGDPLEKMDSANPGTLVCKAGWYAAGIGGQADESSGHLTFNGGVINAAGFSNSKDAKENMGAGIGGGNHGGGTTTIINGGVITAQGAYHAAGIGGGHGNNGYNTCGNGATDRINQHQIKGSTGKAATSGNIFINGGLVFSNGGRHGNAFGGGCNSLDKYNSGNLIKITGGTLIPSSEGNFYDIGASGSYVIVTGGSLKVDGSAKFQSEGGTAYNTRGIDSAADIPATGLPASDRVTMVTVNLSGDSVTDERIWQWDMTVGASAFPYGAPDSFYQGLLYLWLPDSAKKEAITVELTYPDANGNEVRPLPLYRPAGTGDAPLKRYADIDLPDTVLVKDYDGLPFSQLQISQSNPLLTKEDPPKSLVNQSKLAVEYFLLDAAGNPTGSPIAMEKMPVDTCKMKMEVTSTEFSDVDPFSESYWGHKASATCEIRPVPSEVSLFDARWETGAAGAWNAKDTLSLIIDLVAGDGTAYTCKAPTGTLDVYVDNQLVGTIALAADGASTNTENVVIERSVVKLSATNGYDPATGQSGVPGEREHIQIKATLIPVENGTWFPNATASGVHELGVRYNPDKNYLTSASTENVSASFSPAETRFDVYDASDDPAYDPAVAGSAYAIGGKTPIAEGQVIEKRLTDFADASGAPLPKDWFALFVDADSDAAQAVASSDTAVATVEPVGTGADAHAKLHVRGYGETTITVDKAQTGTLRGHRLTFTLRVVRPSFAPTVKAAKSVRLAGADRIVAQVGDTLEYTLTAENASTGSEMEHTLSTAVFEDVLPAGTTLVAGSVALARPGQSPTVLPEGSYSLVGGKLKAAAGSLGPGEKATLTFQVKIGEAVVGATLVNAAAVPYTYRTPSDAARPQGDAKVMEGSVSTNIVTTPVAARDKTPLEVFDADGSGFDPAVAGSTWDPAGKTPVAAGGTVVKTYTLAVDGQGNVVGGDVWFPLYVKSRSDGTQSIVSSDPSVATAESVGTGAFQHGKLRIQGYGTTAITVTREKTPLWEEQSFTFTLKVVRPQIAPTMVAEKSVVIEGAQGRATAQIGDRLNYTLRARNASAGSDLEHTAQTVSFSDALPENVELDGGSLTLTVPGHAPRKLAEGEWHLEGRVLKVTAAALAPGKEAELSFTVTVQEGAAGSTLVNAADIPYTYHVPGDAASGVSILTKTETSNTVSTPVAARESSGIEVFDADGSAFDPAVQGSTWDPSGKTPIAAMGTVSKSYALPLGQRSASADPWFPLFVKSRSTGAQTIASSRPDVVTVDSVGVGSSQHGKAHVHGYGESVITVTREKTSLHEAQSFTFTLKVARPDLSPTVQVEKRAVITGSDRPTARVGDVVEYTVTAKNASEGGEDEKTLKSLTFEDAIPAGLALDEGSLTLTGPAAPAAPVPAGSWSNDGGTLRVDGVPLAPGESCALTFRATVLDSAAGTTLANQAAAAYTYLTLDDSLAGTKDEAGTATSNTATTVVDGRSAATLQVWDASGSGFDPGQPGATWDPADREPIADGGTVTKPYTLCIDADGNLVGPVDERFPLYILSQSEGAQTIASSNPAVATFDSLGSGKDQHGLVHVHSYGETTVTITRQRTPEHEAQTLTFVLKVVRPIIAPETALTKRAERVAAEGDEPDVPYRRGDVVSYKLEFSNNSEGDEPEKIVRGITFRDALPSCLALDTGSLTVQGPHDAEPVPVEFELSMFQGGMLTVALPDVAVMPGETWALCFQAVLSEDAPPAVANVASATATYVKPLDAVPAQTVVSTGRADIEVQIPAEPGDPNDPLDPTPPGPSDPGGPDEPDEPDGPKPPIEPGGGEPQGPGEPAAPRVPGSLSGPDGAGDGEDDFVTRLLAQTGDGTQRVLAIGFLMAALAATTMLVCLCHRTRERVAAAGPSRDGGHL